MKYRLNKKIHNFNEINSEDSVSTSFTLINEGRSQLKIKDIQVDCHCTAIKVFKKILVSGDSTTINIVFHPEISGYGYFNRLIFIHFEDGKEAILTIKGYVKR